jgi:hypothetical protein
MEKYGITGPELTWFKSYLSGRSQVVDITVPGLEIERFCEVGTLKSPSDIKFRY